jgi:hypothetical protein
MNDVTMSVLDPSTELRLHRLTGAFLAGYQLCCFPASGTKPVPGSESKLLPAPITVPHGRQPPEGHGVSRRSFVAAPMSARGRRDDATSRDRGIASL